MILLATALAMAGQIPERVYNRADASAAAVAAELRQCRTVTQGTMGTTELRRPLTPPSGDALAPPGPGGRVTDTIEDCMVARGWNVVAISARDQRRLGRLSPAARDRALGAVTRASRPAYGRIVRVGARLLAPATPVVPRNR